MLFSEKLFVALCTLFSVLIVICNLTYQKFIHIGSILTHQVEISAGAIFYPVIFIITDLIAEFYGREKAKFCISLSIFISIMVVASISLQDNLPATSWSKLSDETFHNIFGFYPLAFGASLLATFVSQNIDAIIYLYIKNYTRSRLIMMRNIISASIGLFVDSAIVVSLMTYFGAIPEDNAAAIILNSYFWKILFIIAASPVFYLLVKILRKFIQTA